MSLEEIEAMMEHHPHDEPNDSGSESGVGSAHDDHLYHFEICSTPSSTLYEEALSESTSLHDAGCPACGLFLRLQSEYL